MRLQDKEKEINNLAVQIQEEKVASLSCFPLLAPPSQIVQNMGLSLQTIT